IQHSVRATSRGNSAEDRLIERAIRASITELQAARASQADEDEALHRAIRASVAEASKANSSLDSQSGSEHQSVSGDSALEQSLLESVREQQAARASRGSLEQYDSEVDTEDDENFKRAITESRRQPTLDDE